MTDKQKELIDAMYEMIKIEEPKNDNMTVDEAREFISKHIKEYKLAMELQSKMFGY